MVLAKLQIQDCLKVSEHTCNTLLKAYSLFEMEFGQFLQVMVARSVAIEDILLVVLVVLAEAQSETGVFAAVSEIGHIVPVVFALVILTEAGHIVAFVVQMLEVLLVAHMTEELTVDSCIVVAAVVPVILG